jgi:hypothetical protein
MDEKDLDDIHRKLLFWETDMPSPDTLRRELDRWRRYCFDIKQPEEKNLIDILVLCDEDIFPNIRQLILVGCTNPIGTCEAERSFSALRRIKTYLRSTMTEERLAGLTMMAVHYEECAQINTEEIVKKFTQANPRRMFCSSILFD